MFLVNLRNQAHLKFFSNLRLFFYLKAWVNLCEVNIDFFSYGFLNNKIC